MSSSDDPTVIRSIAVSAGDVVTAIEASRRGGRETVLRVTPPFSGRMRARLHVPTTEAYDGPDPNPIHIEPAALVAESAPAYPSPARTADQLREDPDEAYSRERHHEYHAKRVDDWRRTLREHITDHVELDIPTGTHEVSVIILS